MIFVGMDVHVRNSFLHATDAEGQRLAHGRRANTAVDLGEFCDRILAAVGGRLQPMRVVLESTTNSRAIQQMVCRAGQEAGFDTRAEVLDARKLRIIAESVCKCDALDAGVLNELARSNLKLPTCYMPDDEEFALREHLRARGALVRLRTMVKNRIHAVLHRRGILVGKAGLFTIQGRDLLKQLELDQAARSIVARYLATLDHLEERISESNRDLREVMRSPRWAKPAALLQTMPGIGVITALTILAELGDLKRFKSRAAVANYAGLVPVVRDSNNKHYSGGVTHRGSAHLRGVLTEAAWMAVPRVPVYTAMFERVAQRRGKAVAIVAVARRMLEDALTLLRKEQAFRFVPVGPSVATGAPRCDRAAPTSERTDQVHQSVGESVASSVAG
jgi:transposase